MQAVPSSPLVAARAAQTFQPDVLPARNRIRRPEDFKRIFRSGRKAGSQALVIHADFDTAHAPRVGFIVSKAVGNAVTRNLVKRRLRAISSELMGQLTGDYVIRALPKAAHCDYAQLKDSTLTALQRINADQRL
ncbi:hypothetical protein HMPREF2757_09690 [Brevibacterium sp. HMSC063G07]|nr:hypothetical protein HMPREF2757_09690 [Brevibacterium sp. HMSC063G07]OFS27580.1 hypothetical protein HMPREF3162_01275 [Brevibacterium sp. HMSC07C04]